MCRMGPCRCGIIVARLPGANRCSGRQHEQHEAGWEDVAGLAAATDTVRMASAWAAGLRVLRAVNHESGDGTDE